MCGFAGHVDLGGLDRGALEPRLARALERLQPRGPDARGTWLDRQCGLANARLAVLDLSADAALPMARHGLVIAYNGEIYNFAELRTELAAMGRHCESRSDTEVLLAGWRQWGEALLPRLVGMFAFALWDPATHELVLARDRYGKKPLMLRMDGQRITFASDLAALEAVADSQPPLDPTALRLLFTLRYVPEPHTIVAGVKKLPPGHLARFTARGLDVRRWFDAAAERPRRYADEANAAQDLVQRFDEAVRCRLVADVPLGVFLSGGIDSALVAAAMTRHAGRVRSFTVGFEGAADYYEERPAAQRVAAYLGTEHTEITVTAEAAREALEAVFLGLDEPFADSSAIPTFLLARETRRHVTVALSGDGADEVFAGYRKYQGELMAAHYQALPRLLRRGVIEPLAARLPERKSVRWLEHARKLRRFVAHAGKDALGRHEGWTRLLPEAALDRLFVAPTPPFGLAALIEAYRRAAGDVDATTAMLHADMALGLAGDMLVKVDRMSMANSLEVRCPFLDHRVVACAEAMPGSFKLALHAGKKILRQAFADRLPAEVFALPKKGFEIPLAEWLTGELDGFTRQAIDPDRLARQGLFRPELPRAWYDDLKARRRDTSEPLWTLVAFQAWCERFRPGLAGL